MQTVYIIATTSINQEKNLTEFSISQEGYSTLEKAQAFCEGRCSVYKDNEFEYHSVDEYHFGWVYKYLIIPISVK